ncbi:MAG TPA: hypothetical protein VGR43_04865 [Dehalococcoidia bacterium]|nr:hypothetical protein [Dehalococcoidia bacterium]
MAASFTFVALSTSPSGALGLTPEIEAAYAECGIDPTELFSGPEIPAYIREEAPERLKGFVDVWVDPLTFFAHRIYWRLDFFNGDRYLLQTEETSSRYSLFNEAELPGPLPD